MREGFETADVFDETAQNFHAHTSLRRALPLACLRDTIKMTFGIARVQKENALS
jgi:hypothetical protein